MFLFFFKIVVLFFFFFLVFFVTLDLMRLGCFGAEDGLRWLSIVC